jgi:hypothetical protein
MADIRHRIGIKAPVADVYEQLATIEGLEGWWTDTVEGGPEVGDTLAFYFHNRARKAVMEVCGLVPDAHVTWRCVEGPDEWIGTTIDFDLRRQGDETVVMFTHADWREPVEFMHHCTTKWGYFLLGLKDGMEGGTAPAHPNDQLISAWG